jgi:copper chaperone CopZ
MTEQTFPTTGLTCGHCAQAVTDELSAIEAVRDVHVALVPGGTTSVTVRADRLLTTDEIKAALEEAGDYRLVST